MSHFADDFVRLIREKKTVFDKNVKKNHYIESFCLDILVFKNSVKHVIYAGFDVAQSENIT